jgi:two-component system response regulator AtoC
MKSVAEFQRGLAGPSLVETDPQPPLQIAGVSAAWNKLLRQAEITAPHLQVAALEGEYGSGKYTLARFLHSRSPLSRFPLQRRDAREWLATDGDAAMISGILYLDRVDLLANLGQGLLAGVLRALQDGPNAKTVVLVSSQKSLRQMAAEGHLLPDLAFRLTAVRFAIPPLRQRREDIAPIAQALLERICARYHQRPVIMGPGALARLLQHTWLDNIRELAGVLESALLEAENGVILPANLPLRLECEARPDTQPQARPEDLSLDAMIRRHVEYVLHMHHGNKLRAAKQLNISRSTLYRILANESIAAS